MPKPTIIPEFSGRQHHFMSIADIYISLGQPPEFVVEPDLDCKYCPDAYAVTAKGTKLLIECQLSRISNPKMQEKINDFAATYPKHQINGLLIYYAGKEYQIQKPEGFQILQKKMPARSY